MADKWLVIRGGSVIDGSGRSPLPNTNVVLHNNRIVAVGDDRLPEAMPPTEGMESIDATGSTVMPGLIDAHCHITYGESRTEEEIDLYTSHELRTLISAANCEKVLRAGVTSFSEPGGSYYIGIGMREGIKRGLVKGPRMTASGRYLTTSNGLTDWYPTSVGVPDGSIGKLTNTVDEMKNEIRRQVKNGADLIKLADSPYGNYQAFTNEELKAVAELVHNLGKKCTIHARGPGEVKGAVAAGFDWIMHANVMDDESIQALVDTQTPVVPTLMLLANRSDWPDVTGSAPHVVSSIRAMLDKSAEVLHRARDAGVRFAFGTDTGFSVTPYGEWHARELELMMTYVGMSPLEAITAATVNGAPMMNLEGELGLVKPGYLADLIVVNGNPAANVRVLLNKRNIVEVIKDGERIEFSEDLDGKRFHHDRLPIVYSTVDLTYDRIFNDDPTPSYTVVPWSASNGRELLNDLGNLQKQVASEGVAQTAGAG
jgi:imidazolonepropionase-like amidohydrolase